MILTGIAIAALMVSTSNGFPRYVSLKDVWRIVKSLPEKWQLARYSL